MIRYTKVKRQEWMKPLRKEFKCSWCSPNKGCNKGNRWTTERNWKRFRQKQWKLN